MTHYQQLQALQQVERQIRYTLNDLTEMHAVQEQYGDDWTPAKWGEFSGELDNMYAELDALEVHRAELRQAVQS